MADTVEDVPTTAAAPPAADGAEEAPKVVKKVSRPSEAKRDAAVAELQTKVDDMLTELVRRGQGAQRVACHMRVPQACRALPCRRGSCGWHRWCLGVASISAAIAGAQLVPMLVPVHHCTIAASAPLACRSLLVCPCVSGCASRPSCSAVCASKSPP